MPYHRAGVDSYASYTQSYQRYQGVGVVPTKISHIFCKETKSLCGAIRVVCFLGDGVQDGTVLAVRPRHLIAHRQKERNNKNWTEGVHTPRVKFIKKEKRKKPN